RTRIGLAASCGKLARPAPPRVREPSKRPRPGRTRREEAPNDVLSVLPLDKGRARERLPEMQHLHAQVTLDRALHARALWAPAVGRADRAGITRAGYDRDVDDWMRTIKIGARSTE